MSLQIGAVLYGQVWLTHPRTVLLVHGEIGMKFAVEITWLLDRLGVV